MQHLHLSLNRDAFFLPAEPTWPLTHRFIESSKWEERKTGNAARGKASHGEEKAGNKTMQKE